MDTLRKLIVGYDLSEGFTQISCFSYKSMEPVPISLSEDGDGAYLKKEESSQIPTALCIMNKTRQWLVGEEAISCAKNGEGILVERILEKACEEEGIELYGTTYSGVALLEKYFRRTLMLIKNYFPAESITKLVVTIRKSNPLIVSRIYEALSLLELERDRVMVINHARSYLYYALSQDRALWMNDVGLFDFSENGFVFYKITINRRTRPMIAQLSKKDYTDTLNTSMLREKPKAAGIDTAYIFENIANTALHKQMITTLYITGAGFLGSWAEEVIKRLCVGRRVFYGQNLFTKGACYAAKELSGDGELKDMLLMDDDMLTNEAAIRVYCDTSFKEVPLIKAGDNWYDVNREIEVIPEGKAKLELFIKNIMTREVTRKHLELDQFPERPERMTRLLIHMTCIDKDTGLITITDLGFGEFYPATGQRMEYRLEFL